jgi:hypothetical protein
MPSVTGEALLIAVDGGGRGEDHARADLAGGLEHVQGAADVDLVEAGGASTDRWTDFSVA